MEVTVNQKIYYSNKEWVPVSEIAESLVALENIVKQSPKIIEALFEDTRVEDVQVFINELKSDSILEDVIVRFVFGSQENMFDLVDKARSKLKVEKAMSNPNMLSAILLCSVLASLAYLYGKESSQDEKKKAVIEANHNTIIQIGADAADMDADSFRAIIEAATKNNKELKESAVKFVKPAKRDSQASITFNDTPQLTVTNESVKAAPSHIQKEDREFAREFKSTEVQIRATDLDSLKKGWGAVAPDVHSRRAKLKFDPSISLKDIVDKKVIIGDITVIFDYDKNNKEYPKEIFLRNIQPN